MSSLKKQIEDFVFRWNSKFVLDRWWRTKYGVPFGSEQHKSTSFIDMRIQWEEDRLMQLSIRARKENRPLSDLIQELEEAKLALKEIDELDLEGGNLMEFYNKLKKKDAGSESQVEH